MGSGMSKSIGIRMIGYGAIAIIAGIGLGLHTAESLLLPMVGGIFIIIGFAAYRGKF